VKRLATVESIVHAAFFLLLALVFDPSAHVQFTLPKLMALRASAAAIALLWGWRVLSLMINRQRRFTVFRQVHSGDSRINSILGQPLA
jgi:hypothetical protein